MRVRPRGTSSLTALSGHPPAADNLTYSPLIVFTTEGTEHTEKEIFLFP